MIRRVGGAFKRGFFQLIYWTPLAALVVGAFVDRSAMGDLRPSLFPLALTCFDPFLWTCAWGSLFVAFSSALGSVVIGTLLAAGTRTLSYWGRPILGILVLFPLAIPPSIATGAWRDSALLHPSLLTDSGSALVDLTPWLIWLTSSLVWGSSLVALVAGSRLERLDPSAIEISRSLGLSTWSRAWSLVWPTIRPAVAHAGSLVFSLVLLDPGPALILGLRRSLAVEALLSTRLVGGLPRAATISLGSIIICVLAHRIVFRPGDETLDAIHPNTKKRHRCFHITSSGMIVFLLALWLSVAFAPLVFLLRSIGKPGLAVTHLSTILEVHGGLNVAVATSVALVFTTLLGRSGIQAVRPRGMMVPPLSIGVGMFVLIAMLDPADGSGGQAGRYPLAFSTYHFLRVVLSIFAMAVAWMTLGRVSRPLCPVPLRITVVLAMLGLTFSAPAIVLPIPPLLAPIGVQVVRATADGEAFHAFSVIAIALNLSVLGFTQLQKRSHLADRFV